MNLLDIKTLEHLYKENFEKNLKGRRILFEEIEPLIQKLSPTFAIEILGHSEKEIPIYRISIGTGKIKILIWSQMHGNESTGTKALFDLFNFFENNNAELSEIIKTILANCTIIFIPLLNPDGAIKFTRENENNIDLNRDAVKREAKESRMLRDILDTFNPKFCFNLHDQRSIFNVEGTQNPATISFLAPSEDIERTVTLGRKETMCVIAAMNKLLQQVIPNQVGRYTDEFYPTATGDNFQKLGHNTILIEAGHYKDDYEREITRKFNFYALLQGIYFIATAKDYANYKAYYEIPNNDTKFLDIIYKNIKITENNRKQITDIGIQLKFKVIDNKLAAYKHIEKVGDLSDYYSYNYISAENLDIKELELSNS